MNAARTLRAAVLFVWGGFFIYLWVSGEQVRYIGPRTSWIVPIGSIILGAAALAHLPFLRGGAQPLRRSDLLGFVVTIVPILLTVIAPAPELGSLAVGKKMTGGGLASALAFAPTDRQGPPSFIDIHYAGLSEEYALSSGIAEGTEVELTGFVSGSTTDGFRLTRFYVSCCAADAVPYSVEVISSENKPADDTWLEVAGALIATDEGFAIAVDESRVIDPPGDPYLS